MCKGKLSCGPCSKKSSIALGQNSRQMKNKRTLSSTIMTGLPSAGYGTLGAVASTVVGGVISRFLPSVDSRIVSVGTGIAGLALTRTKSMGQKFFGYGMAIASLLSLVGPFLTNILSSVTGGITVGGTTGGGALTSGSFFGNAASQQARTINLNVESA